ncbi:hypothetical protein BIW11_10454 [Tropilaelaps mercedesae]|uniref:Uncharacterized protein n=1 Tax=Tropilaelaps mercedesae TaxID=418985 RepID=A0A1V9XG06_9ACAR|nr:hypothetical protein BIW11_10454 [Tropilaelaps mercedesae]
MAKVAPKNVVHKLGVRSKSFEAIPLTHDEATTPFYSASTAGYKYSVKDTLDDEHKAALDERCVVALAVVFLVSIAFGIMVVAYLQPDLSTKLW